MDIHQLKDKAKEFILNPMEDENLPEKEVKEFELPDGSKWNYPVSLGVISLQTDRGTSYETYIMVQNELTRAFNEVRDGGRHEEIRSKILGAFRGSAQCSIQSSTSEDFGGRTA